METLRNHKAFMYFLYLIFFVVAVWLFFKLLPNHQTGSKFDSIMVIILWLAGTAFFIFSLLNTQPEKEIQNIDDSHEQLESKVEDMVKETAQQLSQTRKMQLEKISNHIFNSLNHLTNRETFAEKFLINLAREFELVQALIFWNKPGEELYEVLATYSYYREEKPEALHPGIGLSGQAIKDKKAMFVSDVPEKYGKIISGLGASKPLFLGLIPAIENETVTGLIEVASFVDWTEEQQYILEELTNIAAKKIAALNA